MKRRQETAVAGLVLMAGAGIAGADGFLWLGAEYSVEGHVYRYNIGTGEIDMDLAIPGTSQHWNNCAVDGTYLYLGSPTGQELVRCDATSGAWVDATTYSASLAGHGEDGAYNPTTDTLWRVTYSGHLHETTTSGELLNTWSLPGGLVGLAWVGPVLYTCNWNNGEFGRVNFDGPDVTFETIPWAADGNPPGSTSAGMAYDPIDDVFYLIANNHELYCLAVAGGEVHASLIVDLPTVGYPGGGLVDGMGWAGVFPTCPADIDFNGTVGITDLLTLLGAWGDCTPECPFPCYADLNEDSVVTVQDLLIMLGTWGDCP